MTRLSGQNRFGRAGGWLLASIVSLGGCPALAGDASFDRGQGAGSPTSPLRREAPVFSYRQFTSRLPALPEIDGEAETGDHGPIALPDLPAQPTASRGWAGAMGRFGHGLDAVSAQESLSRVLAESAEHQAEEPGTTATIAERDAPQGSDSERQDRQPRTALLGSGRASWYKHSGRTASGTVYNPNALTAAHHTLPFGTKVKVVNKRNGRAVVVEITDRTNERTKAKRNYAIDLSRASARELGIEGIGQVALYRVE
ncbi:septal ring lytic transglycosylase RlpA family protein [Methylobacterium mesophilicum]|nr:septal ring lytic transglycosylase RlpA family protein [Methylobacterium mesophilicum]